MQLFIRDLGTRFILSAIYVLPLVLLALFGTATGGTFSSGIFSFAAYVCMATDLVYVWHRKHRIKWFWRLTEGKKPRKTVTPSEQAQMPFISAIAREWILRVIVYIPYGIAIYATMGLEPFIGIGSMYLFCGIVMAYLNDVQPRRFRHGHPNE